MSRRNTTTLQAVDKSKLGKPHVLHTMRDVIAGERSLTEEEQKQILTHLLVCEKCQGAFEEIVALTLDDPVPNSANDAARELLAQLKQAHLKREQLNELIVAYMEASVINGVDEADKRFPAFTKHLKRCEICKAEVEDLRVALQLAEEAGLIEPLTEGGWKQVEENVDTLG